MPRDWREPRGISNGRHNRLTNRFQGCSGERQRPVNDSAVRPRQLCARVAERTPAPSAAPAWSASVTAARSCSRVTSVPGSATQHDSGRGVGCRCSTLDRDLLAGQVRVCRRPTRSVPSSTSPFRSMVGPRRSGNVVSNRHSRRPSSTRNSSATASTTSSGAAPEAISSAIAWMSREVVALLHDKSAVARDFEPRAGRRSGRRRAADAVVSMSCGVRD